MFCVKNGVQRGVKSTPQRTKEVSYQALTQRGTHLFASEEKTEMRSRRIRPMLRIIEKM